MSCPNLIFIFSALGRTPDQYGLCVCVCVHMYLHADHPFAATAAGVHIVFINTAGKHYLCLSHHARVGFLRMLQDLWTRCWFTSGVGPRAPYTKSDSMIELFKLYVTIKLASTFISGSDYFLL